MPVYEKVRVYGEVSTIKEKFTNFEEQLHRTADDISFPVRKSAEHDIDIRRLKKA